jgi:recombination protein RecT
MSDPQRGRSITDAMQERRQPGTALATAEPDRAELLVRNIKAELAKQLPPHIPVEYFARTILTGMRKSKALAALGHPSNRRGRASLYAAMLEAARQGLMPFTKEGAIVPYGNEAVWIPQWQGLVKQMYNTGQVAAVEARLIHRHDEWRLTHGDRGEFYHQPFLMHEDGSPTTPEERGEPIYAYCYVVLRDGTRNAVTIVSRQEATEVMTTKSRSWQQAEDNGKRNSSWHTDFDAMWRKTAIRRNFDTAPSSPLMAELLLAAARDDRQRPSAAEPPTLQDLGVSDDVLEAEAVWDSAEDDGPEPEPFDRTKANARLHAMFRDAGFGSRSKADIEVRHGVIAMLGREQPTGQPLSLKSAADLTDEQMARVIGKLAGYMAGPEDGAPPTRDELHDGLVLLARGAGLLREEADAKTAGATADA